MTKSSTLLLFAAGVAAQTVNTTVLGELAQALTSAGFTQLAAAASTIANTTVGSSLLATITNGNDNYTIFAPTDSAISSGNKTILGDPDMLAEIISYHVSPGVSLNESQIFASPNNSIIPTYLNSTDFVNLQGNASQVLSLTTSNGNLEINGQNGTTVDKITQVAGRFTVAQIGHVLTPPGSLSSVLKSNNLTMFTQAAQQAGILDSVASAKGITIFAPTDNAINDALSKLGANATNTTIIATILENHVINGTTVYSTQFATKNYTSAAGEALNSYIFNNTWVVYSGTSNNITANVTHRDLLAMNGVVHIVDAVLANTDRDDGAASSAYNSATGAASNTNNAQPTGPVGTSPGGGDAALSRFSNELWTAAGVATFVGALLASSL